MHELWQIMLCLEHRQGHKKSKREHILEFYLTQILSSDISLWRGFSLMVG